ncbi:hypothetical protein ANANG_G00094730, partial [Anguilla anguilla]
NIRHISGGKKRETVLSPVCSLSLTCIRRNALVPGPGGKRVLLDDCEGVINAWNNLPNTFSGSKRLFDSSRPKI